MKILKIENGKGYFNSIEDNWELIDKIDKDSLMKLLDKFIKFEIELDEYNPEKISHQAHQIIYKSIYDKFKSLQGNKSKFKDESDRTYLSAIQKYQQSTASGE